MTDPSINAATYAENVRREMRDLPADTVADLTDGLEADIAASLADGAELPPAADYARDLMRAAGIEATGIDSVATTITLSLRRVRSWLRVHLGDLIPAWWIIRGWVLAQTIGAIANRRDSQYWFVSQWGEQPRVGIVVVAISIIISVWHARKSRGAVRTVGQLVSVLLIVPFLGLVVAPDHSWNYSFTPGVDYPLNQCAATPTFVGHTVDDILASDIGHSLVNAVTNIVWQMDGGGEMVDVVSGGNGILKVVDQSPVAGTIICGTPVHLYLAKPIDVPNSNPDDGPQVDVNPSLAPSTTAPGRTATTLPPLPKATTTIAP